VTIQHHEAKHKLAENTRLELERRLADAEEAREEALDHEHTLKKDYTNVMQERLTSKVCIDTLDNTLCVCVCVCLDKHTHTHKHTQHTNTHTHTHSEHILMKALTMNNSSVP
jgi:hypothetical protein